MAVRLKLPALPAGLDLAAHCGALTVAGSRRQAGHQATAARTPHQHCASMGFLCNRWRHMLVSDSRAAIQPVWLRRLRSGSLSGALAHSSRAAFIGGPRLRGFSRGISIGALCTRRQCRLARFSRAAFM